MAQNKSLGNINSTMASYKNKWLGNTVINFFQNTKKIYNNTFSKNGCQKARYKKNTLQKNTFSGSGFERQKKKIFSQTTQPC